jgi:hypothetical protein
MLHLVDVVATISGVEVLHTADGGGATNGRQSCFQRCFVLLLAESCFLGFLLRQAGFATYLQYIFCATIILGLFC